MDIPGFEPRSCTVERVVLLFHYSYMPIIYSDTRYEVRTHDNTLIRGALYQTELIELLFIYLFFIFFVQQPGDKSKGFEGLICD